MEQMGIICRVQLATAIETAKHTKYSNRKRIRKKRSFNQRMNDFEPEFRSRIATKNTKSAKREGKEWWVWIIPDALPIAELAPPSLCSLRSLAATRWGAPDFLILEHDHPSSLALAPTAR